MDIASTSFLASLAEVISAASTGQLAFFSLIVSFIFFLTLRFFHSDHPALRTFVFIVIICGAALMVREITKLSDVAERSNSTAEEAIKIANSASMAADSANQAASAATDAIDNAIAAANEANRAAVAAASAAEAATSAGAAEDAAFDRLAEARQAAELAASSAQKAADSARAAQETASLSADRAARVVEVIDPEPRLLGTSVGNMFLDSRSIRPDCLRPKYIEDTGHKYRDEFNKYLVSFDNLCDEAVRISYFILSCHSKSRRIGSWIERSAGGSFELRDLKGTYFTYGTPDLYDEPGLNFYAAGSSSPDEFIVSYRTIPRDRPVESGERGGYPLPPECELLPF
ncbi:MAG: hypothetical protein AAFU59_10920 [Pseudomonadota bacterium]